MAEPGAVAGTIAQVNTQALVSGTHYSSLAVNSSGNDTRPGSIPVGGVGFSNEGAIPSKDGTGATGEHDEVGGEEFEGQQVAMGEQLFGMDNLPESPYYTYHTRELSSGKEQGKHTHHPSRMLGRGMNMHAIRNRVYYGNTESDIFTWNLSSDAVNTSKTEIEKDNVEDVRDV